MYKKMALFAVLAAVSVVAHADLLEVSGFGGYTTVGMKQVNTMLASPKSVPGVDQTKTTDISDGFVTGLDVRSGALIPLPFFEVGAKAEYVGANPGEAAGTFSGQSYNIQENASMLAAMLGLDFNIGIPITGLNFGLSAYGGYGEGMVQQSSQVSAAVPVVPDYYHGGGFVGELEARLGYKLFSVVSLYAFGGMRFANLGTFADAAGQKFNFGINHAAAPSVDFTGLTGGLGLNIDL